MPEFDLPVKLKRFSIGAATANVGIDIHKNFIKLDRVAELGNRRLIGRIIRGRSGDAEGQEAFVDAEELVGAFDTKGVSIKPDFYGTSVTFALTDLDANDLKLFANASGRLVIDDVTAIPEKPKKAAKEKADPAQQDYTADGPWRDELVEDVYGAKPGIVKSLHEADIQTMGDLTDFCAKGNDYTAIKGIGEGKSDWMKEVDVAFWAANPQDEDADPDFDEDE